jgi:hypothetical protein
LICAKAIRAPVADWSISRFVEPSLKQLLVSVRVSHDDFSNTRTPQNRDSHESAEVRCVQFLFEPGAILLNGFYRNL